MQSVSCSYRVELATVEKRFLHVRVVLATVAERIRTRLCGDFLGEMTATESLRDVLPAGITKRTRKVNRFGSTNGVTTHKR